MELLPRRAAAQRLRRSRLPAVPVPLLVPGPVPRQVLPAAVRRLVPQPRALEQGAPAASSFSVGDILAGVPRMARSSCNWLLASAARRRTPCTLIAPDLVAMACESLLFVRPNQMP